MELSMESLTTRVNCALEQWKHATLPLSKPQTTVLPSNSRSCDEESPSRAKSQENEEDRPDLQDHDDQQEATEEEEDEEDEEEAVKCRPWSHQDFMDRLNSFQILTWFAKPESIGVFECVRRGWSNAAKDQLHCKSCGAYLCFSFDERLSDAGTKAVAAVYAKQLVTGHDTNCLWRESASPESFTMLPIASPRDVVSALDDRLETMLSDESREQLARVAIETAAACDGQLHKQMHQLDMHKIINALPKLTDSIAESKPNERLVQKALVLAVCGWTLHGHSVLRCGFCNRQVGLWNFEPGNAGDASSPSEVRLRSPLSSPVESSSAASGSPLRARPSVKRRRVDHAEHDNQSFDPIAQHRWFCPWVKAPVRELTGSWLELKDMGELNANPVIADFFQLCGWQQVVKALELQTQTATQLLLKTNRNQTVSLTPQKALELVHEVMRGV